MSDNVNFIDPPRATNVGSSSSEEGYVKGVVTYMVMDDLVVKPMSTISCVTLLNRFNVKDVGVLEEKVVDLGIDEVCQSIILWFLCMSPLITTVFIFSFYFPFFRHGEIYCEITLN